MIGATNYGRALNKWVGGAQSSARVVVPLVVDLLHPVSVVDVGCGLGAWLSVFADSGISDFAGVDGAPLAAERLLIPPDHFRQVDLAKPFTLDRRFDLVLSLEVAEHLPEASASTFVSSLAALGDQHLFSAAIPFQGGLRHLNEQWPQYWIDLFAQHGLQATDPIRRLIWDDDRVEWWYAQNILVFATEERIAANERLKGPKPLTLVHPRRYLLANQSIPMLILSRMRARLSNRTWRR